MVIPLLGRRLARQPSPLQTRAARCGQTIQGRRFGNPEFRIDYASTEPPAETSPAAAAMMQRMAPVAADGLAPSAAASMRRQRS